MDPIRGGPGAPDGERLAADVDVDAGEDGAPDLDEGALVEVLAGELLDLGQGALAALLQGLLFLTEAVEPGADARAAIPAEVAEGLADLGEAIFELVEQLAAITELRRELADAEPGLGAAGRADPRGDDAALSPPRRRRRSSRLP